MRLVQQVRSLIPEGREVVFLADCEFDGVELLDCLGGGGWKYACRTTKNTLVYWEHDVASGDTGTPIRDRWKDFGLKSGQGVRYQALYVHGRKPGLVQTGAAWESNSG